MSNFASMFKYLRKRSNLTQSELAEQLGLAKSTISMYETGSREPEFETLEVIADYFNVDINFLLGTEKLAIESNDESSVNMKRLYDLFSKVPEDQQSMVLSMIEAALKSQGLLQ